MLSSFEAVKEPRQWAHRVTRSLPYVLAEFSGTAVAIFLGLCTSLSTRLSAPTDPEIRSFANCCGWGLAFMAGNCLAVKVSGAHLNPALSLAYALLKKMPWKRCALYIACQITGGLFGAGLAVLMYPEAIQHSSSDMKMAAAILQTGPVIPSNATQSFVSEFVATFFLIVTVCTLTGDRRSQSDFNLASIKIGLSTILIMLALGHQTGPTLNPARDTGPRLVALWIGADDAFDDGFWWYGGWLATTSGAFLGALAEDRMSAVDHFREKDTFLPCHIRSKGFASRSNGPANWIN